MASTTRSVVYAAGAYLQRAYPSRHTDAVSGADYMVTDYYAADSKQLILQFQDFPDSLKHNKIYGTTVYLRVNVGQGFLNIWENDSAFNSGSVTWNSRPSVTFQRHLYQGDIGDKGTWHDVSCGVRINGLRYGITVTGDIESFDYDWYVTPGSQFVSATVHYDDSVLIKSKVVLSSGPSGSVSSLSPLSFSWYYTQADTSSGMICYAPTWAQRSAILYWKESDSNTWKSINISGSSLSYTAPAYTFPFGKTIQYYIQGTDEDGTVTTTATSSFSTYAVTLAVTSAPSGSNIDTRNAISFSWRLSTTGGTVAQTAATLYWRVSGAANYTQVPVSPGSSQSVSIPANTFPTGKTIQWYVSATISGGTVLSSAAATFSTVSTRITLDTYPSGNGVYTAQGLAFSWHYESNVGNYNQSAAKFYWRASTSSPYTQISISGNTKSLTVPANTFPTGQTIQWYIEGTDIGGLTSTTSVLSFKTVTTQITPQSSPTSGYADPRLAITFQWYFASTGGPVPQSSATFYWRESGTENWSSVAASGTTAQVTIPADTFPVGSSVEWYIAGTDIGGTSSTSTVFTFSTTAATAYAYPKYPVGITADSSKPITMRWELVNDDGTLPIKVLLQWKKTTSVSWTTIHEASEAFTTWEIVAGFFPVGPIEWRVIATNRDGTDGPAGTAAFVSVRAPDAPVGLSATPVPRTVISWQATDQEGYEIYIDGESVTRAYGTGNNWQPDFVLEDGIHVISVRVQGPFGLWSEPSFTTVAIENQVPEGWEDLAISGEFGVDADLQASGAEALTSPTINWFRDGKRIAVTEGLHDYEDRYVLGRHSWYVEIWNSNGNYARSNAVIGTLQSCVTRIAPFSGGQWLELTLSENSADQQTFSYERTASLRHVLGAKYPVLELSAFEDRTGKYDCAFKDVESAAAFEALHGQRVIVKSRGGNVMIGALLSLSKRYGDFFITYTFSVRATEWEDFRHVSQNG